MTSILLSACLLALLALPGLAEFNCTRLGMSCNNRGTCEGGLCVCQDATTAGYDCSQNTLYINQGACQFRNPCQNGGTCYDSTSPATTGTTLSPGTTVSPGTPSNLGTPQCYCPYGFYGEQCEMPSVFNECFNDQMVVNINPGKNFVGIVAVQHKGGFCDLSLASSQMEFTLDPARSEWEGYAGVLPFTGAVCGDGPAMNVTPTEITYTYDVLIRYDASGATPELDEVVSFSCTVPNTAGIVATDTAFPTEPTPVQISVSDARGAYLARPRLGDPFTIRFRADLNTLYTDVLVRSCTVYNSNRTMSQLVVQDSCPLGPIGQSLEKQGDEHVLTLVTHVFQGDPDLQFDCDVKVCKPGDFSCRNQPFCLSPSPLSGGANVPSSSDILGLLAGGGTGGAAGSSVLDSLFSTGGGAGGGASMTDIFSTFGGGPGPMSGGGATAGGGVNTMMDMTGASAPSLTNLLDGPMAGFFGGGATAGGGGAMPPTVGRRRRSLRSLGSGRPGTVVVSGYLD